MSKEIIELGKIVYHSKIYQGKELMEIVGIRKDMVELQGDYSGGTSFNRWQTSWMPIKGLLFKKNEKPWDFSIEV